MPRTTDPTHNIALGQRLRARRQWVGLGQIALGAAVGVTHQMIAKYERGAADPSSRMLVKIAAALQTTPAALLAVEGQPAEAAEATALFADRSVGAIITRLRGMTPDQRKHAHALLCTIRTEP